MANDTPQIRQDVMDHRRAMSPTIARNQAALERTAKVSGTSFTASWTAYTLGRLSPYGWKIGLMEAHGLCDRRTISPELEAAINAHLESIDLFQAVLDAEIAKVRR